MKTCMVYVPIVILASLLMSGCLSTDKSAIRYQKLLTKTPFEHKVSMDYIDAFANAKYNYDKCVAREGVKYPITVSTMGTPVTVTGTTPSIFVKSSLDRQAQIGILNVYADTRPISIVQFISNGDHQTVIKVFNARQSPFSSNTKILERLQKDIQSRYTTCP
ncbi:hypothetical protein ACFBZI_04195 [Moraxella sp. ZJ142]|uniref:hypothetical protein n=1 Tax=Moraxella marmotae TaxID=3344520 RepID=UPI0035D4850C